ncbi:hypothetical protein JCM10450v2_007645 [Rhodotorula kratochvilovae]
MEWQMDSSSPLTSLASSSDRSPASPRPTAPSSAPAPLPLAPEQSFAASEHADVLDLKDSPTADDDEHRECEAVQPENAPHLEQDDVEMSAVEAKPDQHGEIEDREMCAALYEELPEEGELEGAWTGAEVDYEDEEDKIVLVAPANKVKQDERTSPDSPPSHERGVTPWLPPLSESPLLKYAHRPSPLPPQGLAWQTSGRFESSASPPRDARVPPPEPPLTPRSRTTASRFNPFRFAYAHPAPPPPEAEIWQYKVELPFHGMGGRLIGVHGQVALDIRDRAGACELQVLFREDRTAHCVIIGSKASIKRALAIVEEVAHAADPNRTWTKSNQYALAQTDPRWCQHDDAYMERYPGFCLRDEYIERDEFDYRWAKYGDVRGDTLLLDTGDRYAPTPDAAHIGPPVNRHQTRRNDRHRGQPSQVAQDRRSSRSSRSPAPSSRSRDPRTSSSSAVHLEPRYAPHEGKKRKRDRSHSPSRSRARSSRLKSSLPSENIPVSAIPLFVGASASTHFIKQTTGVDIKLVSDAINAELVLQPAAGTSASKRSLDEAHALVMKVLASSGVATSGSSREKEKERGAPRMRREASPHTPASYSPPSPRSDEHRKAYAHREPYDSALSPRGDRDSRDARERDELRERAQTSRRYGESERGRSRRDDERESGRRDSGWSGWSDPKWERRGERRREERYEGEDAERGRGKETRRSSPDRHHRSRERPRSRSPRRNERERTHRTHHPDRDEHHGYRSPAMSGYEPRYADPARPRAFPSEGYPPPRAASSHSREFDVGGGPLHIQEQRRLVLMQRGGGDGRGPEREWDREAMRARAEGTAKEASPGWGQRGAGWHQTWSGRRKPADRTADARGGE